MHFLLVSHLLFNWGLSLSGFPSLCQLTVFQQIYMRKKQSTNLLTKQHMIALLIRCFRIISAEHMTKFCKTLRFIFISNLVRLILFWLRY